MKLRLVRNGIQTAILSMAMLIVGLALIGCASVVPATPAPAAQETQEMPRVEIQEEYQEQQNADLTAVLFYLEYDPLMVFQIFHEENRASGESELGLFLQLSHQTASLYDIRQISITADEERFDFFGVPATQVDLMEGAEERSYYFAAPPDPDDLISMRQMGGASFQDQLSVVRDPDPEETQVKAEAMLAAISEASSIDMVLYGVDRDPYRETLTGDALSDVRKFVAQVEQ